MITASTVTTNSQLESILALQQQNLRGFNDPCTEKDQGFVTVTHSLELLQQMQAYEPSIIATDGTELAGYALAMSRACASLVPELFSLFSELEKFHYRGIPLQQQHYYVMGQVCVAKAYRGRGVFDLLYAKHKELFQGKYHCVITEIATRNTRSLRAHSRVGFSSIATYTDHQDEWLVVAWDWSSPVH